MKRFVSGCGEDEHTKHREGRLGEGGARLHETSSKAKLFFFQVAEWTLKCCRHLNIVNLMGVCLPTDMHPLLLLELCEVFGLIIIPNVNSMEDQSSACSPQTHEDNNNHAGKSGEAAPEEQGGLFASRHKTPQSKFVHHSKATITNKNYSRSYQSLESLPANSS